MRGNKHPLRLSHSEFQKLQGNFAKPKNRDKISESERRKRREDEEHNKCVIFITFYISDNRGRDLDGMCSTVFDCLVKSGKIRDDKRQYLPMFITDFEFCEKGTEGFRVRIITR